jgi:DNA-binding CsgD family transcriptional regulator
MLTAVLPALTSVFTLAFSHEKALRSAYWEGIGRVNDHGAALLLDERCRVIVATPPALAMVNARDGLSMAQEMLHADDPGDDARIVGLTGTAVGSLVSRSGAVRIRRPSGRAPYVVVAHALPRRQRMIAPLEAAALVTIVDPTATTSVAADLWRSAFALTAREAEVAVLLMSGHSAESAAAVLGIGLPTARIHLSRLLAKTGTGRQSELVRLLGRIR